MKTGDLLWCTAPATEGVCIFVDSWSFTPVMKRIITRNGMMIHVHTSWLRRIKDTQLAKRR